MKKHYEKFITPIILLVIALFLFGFSFYSFCQACTGWNIINPFCHLGYASCMIQQGLFQMIMRFGSVILFIVSIILFIRAGLKK